MTMVDWLLTEQLVEIFRDARVKRPALNAELLGASPHGESDRLAGAGITVRIDTTMGEALLVTPRRIARQVGEGRADLVVFSELVGYDWISPLMSEKVDLKDEHYDRLYLYTRAAPPVVLDNLGDAVYPLMTFLGRALEYRSQKVLLRKLDNDLVETLGACLGAAAHGTLFGEDELVRLFGRNRDSMQVLAAMWPRVNLAAPDLLDLLERLVGALVARGPGAVDEPAGAVTRDPARLEAALEVFRRVVTGEV